MLLHGPGQHRYVQEIRRGAQHPFADLQCAAREARVADCKSHRRDQYIQSLPAPAGRCAASLAGQRETVIHVNRAMLNR
jgi:hypothetical protein